MYAMPSARSDTEPLDQLGPIFRWSDARDAGLTNPRLYRMLDRGDIERIGHGLYKKAGWETTDTDLMEIAAAAPRATLCLLSALAHHDLTDQIPSRYDIALPRGTWHPRLPIRIRWHSFGTDTFELGRSTLLLESELTIGIYSPERSIIDAYRLRHIEGDDLGREALKRWLRRGTSQPSDLLRLSQSFPKAEGLLRHDLQVLL